MYGLPEPQNNANIRTPTLQQNSLSGLQQPQLNGQPSQGLSRLSSVGPIRQQQLPSTALVANRFSGQAVNSQSQRYGAKQNILPASSENEITNGNFLRITNQITGNAEQSQVQISSAGSRGTPVTDQLNQVYIDSLGNDVVSINDVSGENVLINQQPLLGQSNLQRASAPQSAFGFATSQGLVNGQSNAAQLPQTSVALPVATLQDSSLNGENLQNFQSQQEAGTFVPFPGIDSSNQIQGQSLPVHQGIRQDIGIPQAGVGQVLPGLQQPNVFTNQIFADNSDEQLAINGQNVQGASIKQTQRFVDDFAEPAEYNFKWNVNDEESGNFYGHEEERNGPNTRGK